MRRPGENRTWVRADCRNCGQVTVPLDRALLVRRPQDDPICRIRCYCGAETEVSVDSSRADRLLAAGVAVEERPITREEVMRFVAALDHRDIVEEARRSLR